MRNIKIFSQKRFSPYLENSLPKNFKIFLKNFQSFSDELETFGKLEAKKWAHIPHVQTQAAFELSDEAFQVKIFVHIFTRNLFFFRQNIW